MAKHFHSGMAAIVFLVTTVVMASAAHADGLWQIESQSGDVRVAAEGVTPVSLSDAQALPAGTRISTGSTGRMILRRGDEAIVVAPNTSIELAPESRQGLATTIIQSIGTILLSVDKKEKQHFEVETPYLAAVVKGTKFAVTVADGKSSVHVVQGAVEVLDFASGDVGMVRPGQTADVAAGSGLGLTVTGPGAVAPTRAQRTGRTPRVALPAAAASSADSSGAPVAAPSPMRINAPMGDTTPDMTSATGGLVRQASLDSTAIPSGANASTESDLGGEAGTSLAFGPVASLGTLSDTGGSGLALSSTGSGAGGNGNGLALGLSNGNGNSGNGNNAGGNGNGLALGLSNGNGNSGNGNNAGGNGNGNANGNRSE